VNLQTPDMSALIELNVIIAGVGGQGVLFTTRLLAQTSVYLGQSVMVSEVHGMSQRGGSVISHLRIGSSEAPLIRRGTADLLLGLAPDEAVRNLAFLRRGGVAFVNSENGVQPELWERLSQLDVAILSLPASRLAMELGYPWVVNTIMTGFAAAHPILQLPVDALSKTLAALAPRRRDPNLKALEIGCRAAADAG
jgi:indolepyruvate ferredoxin oxidoreductase beta subunit